ncbi:MAG: hypothetical protein ACTXOO_00635 [Sodalis sp. (in: enterobacteria)]
MQKNTLYKRTGDTVKGDIILQGAKLLLQGDRCKHLGFHNQEGSIHIWL